MKSKILFGLTLMALTVGLNCGKNNVEHAPACPYGQILAFDGSNYTCRFINLSAQPYGNQIPQSPGGVLTPPIAQCRPSGTEAQELVYWINSYYCIYSSIIRPGGDNSPKGQMPPQGRGGEFCTSAGMNPNNWNYNYQNPGVGTNGTYGGYNPYQSVVVCSPGYQCQSDGQVANGTYNGQYTPGQQQYPNQQYPNQGYTNPYNTSGQSGTCVFSGYRGY